MRKLAVIGAINVDLVVTGPRLPGAGETVTGGTFARHHGGKGGNQAVAAARALGPGGSGRAVLIGAVGDDELGASALESLAAEDVILAVDVMEGVPTGVALIVVDRRGENQIAVAPGANARVTARQVERALEQHTPALMLTSLEVAEEAVRAAGGWCRSHKVPLVLNPAPAQPWLRDVVAEATYVTPNEIELAAIGDHPPGVVIVETRGAGGVRVHGDPDLDVPAPRVEVLDTTGAGDTFNGVFAAGLLDGLELEAAARRAVAAAALSVTAAGAREGMPTRAQIDGVD